MASGTAVCRVMYAEASGKWKRKMQKFLIKELAQLQCKGFWVCAQCPSAGGRVAVSSGAGGGGRLAEHTVRNKQFRSVLTGLEVERQWILNQP